MTALSIHIPEALARASRKAAQKLGISRSSFIRTAILHELQHVTSQSEEEGIAKSLTAMGTNQAYIDSIKGIEDRLNTMVIDFKILTIRFR